MQTTLKHYASANFWKHFDNLPQNVQTQARRKYVLLKKNPLHSALRFQAKTSQYWAARVNPKYRALARYMGNGQFLWVWIGEHREYERLLRGK